METLRPEGRSSLPAAEISSAAFIPKALAAGISAEGIKKTAMG